MSANGFGSRDTRFGQGAVFQGIVQPTHTIPCDCACSWTVIVAAPGGKALSRLSYRSAMCRHRHVPAEVPRG